MKLQIEDLNKLIVVGDRILLRPESDEEKTESGLYLPPGVNEKEKIKAGYVLKTGPGYPVASPVEDEPWREQKEPVKYIPLQVKEGDLAIFLKRDTFEIEYGQEKLYIVSQAAILMLVRDDILNY